MGVPVLGTAFRDPTADGNQLVDPEHPLPVTLAPGAAVGIAGGAFGPLNVRKTRPNDTNNYAANDAVNESASAGTNWTFAGLARVAAGSGVILRAHVETSDAAKTPRVEIDLYTVNPTAINDNAEATRLTGNVANFVGTITFPALAKKTSSSTVAEASADVRLPFKCAAATSLFGILRLLDAVATPTAQATWDVNLFGIQD